MDKVEFIAKVRYLGWLCYQLGGNLPIAPHIEPNDSIDSIANGVKYILDNPNATAEGNHNNWMNLRLEQGWTYGEVLDRDKRTHPSLVPFDDLPDVEKRKDHMDILMTRLAEALYHSAKAEGTSIEDVLEKELARLKEDS